VVGNNSYKGGEIMEEIIKGFYLIPDYLYMGDTLRAAMTLFKYGVGLVGFLLLIVIVFSWLFVTLQETFRA